MWTLISYLAVAVAAFITGLLVGRKNPKMADKAAELTDSAAKLAGKV